MDKSAHECDQYDEVFKTKIDHDVHRLRKTMDKHSEPNRVNLSRISVDEVTKLCLSLSPGKAPGLYRITYEHIKYGGRLSYETLTRLYNAVLNYVHIRTYTTTIQGLLVTIYKGHGKPKDKNDSYRGVTLLPAINKVFEKCMLNRIQPFFDEINFPAPLQNTSRKGISNVMVSFMANEAIYYCTENGG